MGPAGGQPSIDPQHHGSYHDFIERTTISITDGMHQRFRMIVAERRTSSAALVREALEEETRRFVHDREAWGSRPWARGTPLAVRPKSVPHRVHGAEPKHGACRRLVEEAGGPLAILVPAPIPAAPAVCIFPALVLTGQPELGGAL